MPQPIEPFAVHLSKQARRAVAALLISGCLLSSQSQAGEQVSDAPLGSGLAAAASRERSDASLDYWIFSDDYCGWASAESLVSPYAMNPLAKEPIKAMAAGVRPSTEGQAAGVSAEDLAALAAKEPIDVARPTDAATKIASADSPTPASSPNTATSAVAARSSIGAAPVIATISEGYLPYDLSRADQIALRMYPITIPQFNYVGGKRLSGMRRDGQGPLDCLGYGVLWSEEVLPSRTVSTSAGDASGPLAATVGTSTWQTYSDELTKLGALISREFQRVSRQTDFKRRALAVALVKSMQPASAARHNIVADRLGWQAGTGFVTAFDATQAVFRETADRVALWRPAAPRFAMQRPSNTAGEQLLVRAGVEADALDCATAGVADNVAESVCCPVERVELAAQPPRNRDVAIVEVAAATLSVPQEPLAPRDPMARAEAIATVCDSAAATLERWALALRRAGDSVVRVARSSAKQGSALR